MALPNYKTFTVSREKYKTFTWKIQNIHTVSREIYKTFTLYHMKITKHLPCITWKNTKHSHCITWKIQNIHTVSSEKEQTVNNGHELKVPALCFQPKEYVKYADLIMELRLCLHKSSAGGNIPVTFEVLYISAKDLRQWEVNFNRNNHVKAPDIHHTHNCWTLRYIKTWKSLLFVYLSRRAPFKYMVRLAWIWNLDLWELLVKGDNRWHHHFWRVKVIERKSMSKESH